MLVIWQLHKRIFFLLFHFLRPLKMIIKMFVIQFIIYDLKFHKTFFIQTYAPKYILQFTPEHVSEAERRDTPLKIPLCGRALRSVAHGQSKRSANVPLTLTGKPNPAQITL